jgi:hypothetical protein
MQPSGDSGDSSSDEQDDTEDESSVGSEDAEELAYLRQVEKSIPTNNNNITRIRQAQPVQQQRQQITSRRIESRASSQHSGHLSMMTAPSELRRLSQSSSSAQSINLRPVSSLTANRRTRYDDSFDDSVNPWVLHPSTRQFKGGGNEDQEQDNVYRSPLSTSSSVTATQYNNSERYALGGRSSEQQVSLGPATKRALESIQHEIEALNERINGLRKEIVDRDTRKSNNTPIVKKSSLPEDGWKWVIKVRSVSVSYVKGNDH